MGRIRPSKRSLPRSESRRHEESSIFYHNRRTFLKYLAGSPYIAALGGIRIFAQRAPEIAEVIANPKEAFSVMDFEEATRRKVDPVHYASS